MYSKASCIFDIVWYSILILFGVWFCLCPFVVYVNEILPTWKIFMWGFIACFEFLAGSLGLGSSIDKLIKCKQKEKNSSDDKDKWY